MGNSVRIPESSEIRYHQNVAMKPQEIEYANWSDSSPDGKTQSRAAKIVTRIAGRHSRCRIDNRRRLGAFFWFSRRVWVGKSPSNDGTKKTIVTKTIPVVNSIECIRRITSTITGPRRKSCKQKNPRGPRLRVHRIVISRFFQRVLVAPTVILQIHSAILSTQKFCFHVF